MAGRQIRLLAQAIQYFPSIPVGKRPVEEEQIIGQPIVSGRLEARQHFSTTTHRIHVVDAREVEEINQGQASLGVVIGHQHTQGAAIGVIATPAGAAQSVCDRLVTAGVTSILNFAPVVLTTPDHVGVRKVDLATELQILAFHEQRRSGRAEVTA